MSDIDLTRLRELAMKATPGPWSVLDGSNKVGCDTPSKDWHVLFDVQGWDFFTGRGHRGLGWSGARAFEQQNANAEYVAACSPDVILKLLDMVEGRK